MVYRQNENSTMFTNPHFNLLHPFAINLLFLLHLPVSSTLFITALYDTERKQ